MRIANWLGLGVIVLAMACGNDSKQAAQDADQLLEKWRQAGLEVGEYAPLADPGLGEAECQRGAVAGIETTVCRFPSDEAAKAAQQAGLEMVGKTTGAALPRGPLLLVVADRKNTDPNGKTINQLTKIFLGR